MKFSVPLIKGIILSRYKRFLCDIQLEDNSIITAHVANTGSMTTCWKKGWPVLLSYNNNPARKLRYSLEMTHNGITWIGVNTHLTNKLAQEGIENGTIPELQGYTNIKPEVKIGQSRIDFLLHNHHCEKCYVEVKNVTLQGGGNMVLFPDAVSKRGQKHLEELMAIKKQGYRAVILYIIQREDADCFSTAKEIDPCYSDLLVKAAGIGVEVLAYGCVLTVTEIRVQHCIPVQMRCQVLTKRDSLPQPNAL